MKCKKMEKLILRSLDSRLEEAEKASFNHHLQSCAGCQRKHRDYQMIFQTFKTEILPDPKPYFWQRLQPKLSEYLPLDPWVLWKRWSLRAIPLSLLMAVLIAGSAFLRTPETKEELSPSEVLLLRNLNPLQETKTILEQERVEDKSMMLIFTAMEEKSNTRRYVP